MYEIRENRRRLKDGTEITTYTRDIYSCNILEFSHGLSKVPRRSSSWIIRFRFLLVFRKPSMSIVVRMTGSLTSLKISATWAASIKKALLLFIRPTEITAWIPTSTCAVPPTSTLLWRMQVMNVLLRIESVILRAFVSELRTILKRNS